MSTGDNPSHAELKNNQKTQVFYDNEKILQQTLETFSITEKTLDGCIDQTEVSMHVLVEQIWNGLCYLKEKGVKLRLVTEITSQNLSYCKKMMEISEVRHLDGVRTNFGIADGEQCLLHVISKDDNPLTHAIVSNVKEMVEAEKYLFETLWSKAIPAEERIREIEYGHLSEKTEVSHGIEFATKTICNMLSNSKEKMDICADKSWPSVAMGVDVFRKEMMDIGSRHNQSRFITEITTDNITFCKELLRIGKLKHLGGVKGNFAISEKEYIASATMAESQLLVQVIYSNVKAVVEQHQYLFETLWSKAIPAEERIREIEDGFTHESTEVIENVSQIKEIYLNLIKEAKEEILIIFPSYNAIYRQKRIGVIDLVKQKAIEGVKVKVLTPIIEDTEKILSINDTPLQKYNDSKEESNKQKPDFLVKEVSQQQEIKFTVLIVDKRYLLTIELTDDSKLVFEDAVGFSTYSNSKLKVLSYVSIFENFWQQTELYEKLKTHDKMQRDFINIAAHELRTPVQSIMGYTQLAMANPEYGRFDKEHGDFLEAINRNANRLRKLTEEILDVARIESNTLKIDKERFNLNELILEIISNSQGKNKSIYIKGPLVEKTYGQLNKDDLVINADKERISQVLYNILDNAIKFTNKDKGDKISVSVETDKFNNEVIVSVKDTGKGIHKDILPNLFTKFASKSDKGTGLGLFVSKSIIEAHGGRIWGENNKDGKGATFSFSLPLKI